ncbi:AMP-binding protein [Enemella sp. A6]|uniref:AMP-binding protein n=1 Tax=Enemella sp. A6 TaxID=3440152 RepID=UPI003EC0B140
MPVSDPLHRPAYQGDLLITALRRQRNVPVLQVGDETITGQQFADWISTVRQALISVGLGPGSTTAMLSPNRPEVLVQLGVGMVLGLRNTPVGTMASLDDQASMLTDGEVETLIFDPMYAERAAELAERVPTLTNLFSFGPAEVGTDLLALAEQFEPEPLVISELEPWDYSSLVYTGGTTGRPKAVIGTYGIGNALNYIQMSEWQMPDRPRFLFCTPLTHAGAAFFLPVLLRGGTLIVLPAFEPGAVLEAIEKYRITALMLVPTMIYKVLDHPDLATRDHSSLERIYYGAAAMSPTRLAEGLKVFGQVFFQFYGQTECGMTICVLKVDEHLADNPDRLASAGRPVPWLHVKLLDDQMNEVPTGEVGEICVRGPLVMSGYWNRVEETEEALRGNWLHTGDMAKADEDGFLTIVDRRKDMIVSGGFNVFPREVEDVIATHPAVSQVAVIGVPHPTWGEAVTACVVLREGAQVDPDELVAMVRAAKGPVHAPKTIEIVDTLPVTPLGKLDKKRMRAERWEGHDRQV